MQQRYNTHAFGKSGAPRSVPLLECICGIFQNRCSSWQHAHPIALCLVKVNNTCWRISDSMGFDSWRHQRHSIRLADYDYSQPGAYFVTICTYGRLPVFGDIQGGRVLLNAEGELVTEEWLRTEVMRKRVRLDAFVVMPNHLHGILVIQSELDKTDSEQVSPVMQFGKPTSDSVPTIIRSFKAAVTHRINICQDNEGNHIWQRGYYEHIVRSITELHRIRRYIQNNPMNWAEDEDNPNNWVVDKR